MFNPYENVIIGNFIYSLGLAMGRQARPVDGCVNLLQQTPADPALGDVVLQFPGVWRLIEFKRYGGDDEKEQVKREMFLAATAPDGRAHLHRVSRQVHWYLHSGPDDPRDPRSSFSMRVRPYLEDETHVSVSMEVFVQDLVEQAGAGHLTDLDELGDYMAVVKTLAGIKRFNAGGLLVGVNGGGIAYLPVPNFADLRGTANMLNERYVEAQKQLSAARELQAARDAELLVQRDQRKLSKSAGREH